MEKNGVRIRRVVWKISGNGKEEGMEKQGEMEKGGGMEKKEKW